MALRAALLVFLVGLVPAGAQERAQPAQERAAPERGPHEPAERANLVRPTMPVPPDLFPIATDARLGGDANRTRLIVDLSRTVEVAAFTLADPYRVVVDLPQITFQLAARTGTSPKGLIKAFRYGLVMQGGSRLVIDATGPVRVDRAFALEAVDNQPARLVIDLVSIDRAAFMRNLALQNGQPRATETRKAEPAKRPSNDGRPLVVIDPGHGGPDTGTIAASGEMEKAIVLEFAQALQAKLEKSGKYRVAMTRTDDRFVALGERVRMARNQGAALFVSIHADALAARGESDVRGATVYTVSDTATDAEAARLAEDENKADAIAGVDLSSEPEEVADILIDLTQRETKNFSNHFARAVVGELKTAAKLHKHPLKSAGFKVLKAPDVPSVLIELGYVSNKRDLKLMMSEAWRARTTDAVAQAVNTFFSTRLAGSAGRRAN
jgi:N-acetylmuramoyl-L-alanine amidase